MPRSAFQRTPDTRYARVEPLRGFRCIPTVQGQLKALPKRPRISKSAPDTASAAKSNNQGKDQWVCPTLTMVMSWAEAREVPASRGKTPSSHRQTTGETSEIVVPAAAAHLCPAGAGRGGWPWPHSTAHAVGSERACERQTPRRRFSRSVPKL